MAGCRDEAKLARDAAVERVEELSDGDEHQCGNDAPRCEHDRRRRAHAKRRPRHLIGREPEDRKSTRLNSSHSQISYAVFCLKKKNVRLGGPQTQPFLLHASMPRPPAQPVVSAAAAPEVMTGLRRDLPGRSVPTANQTAAVSEAIKAGAELGAELAADGIDIFSYGDDWNELADVPPNTVAALILLEHHWAVTLRDAIARFFFLRIAPPPISPLFPPATLFI